MLKTSVRVWKLTACNLFGLNELRYTRDTGKRKRAVGLGLLWVLVILMMEGYLIASMLGYVKIGMAEILPIYCYAVTGILILMLTLLKAGNVIFQWNSLENLLAMPIHRSAILIARFLNLYTTNLLFAAAVMLPGMIIYGMAVGAGPVCFVVFLLGILFAPLLPLTLATGLSALVKGISSRMKYKSLVEAALMIVFSVGIIALLSGGDYEAISVETIKKLTNTVVGQLSAVYPPAAWFQKSATEETLLPMLALILVSLAAFTVLMLLLNRFFLPICTALRQTGTKHHGRIVTGDRTGLKWALVKREFRYYFSQSLYISNTAIGLVMMVAGSVAVSVIGPEAIEGKLGMQGIVVKLLPYFLALCGCIMSTTSASVSLEGKTRWLTRSLPIPEKTQYDSKILMALLLDLPFYLAAVVTAAIGMKTIGADLVRLIVIPAVFLVFAAVIGLYANLLFPRFDWDNEVQVIKQGAATAVAMFASMGAIILSGGLFAAAHFLFPTPLAGNIVSVCTTLVLILMTLLFYRSVRRKKLEQ
ncbi:MAG: hypothetical protein ACI4FY_08280 [Acetatifactor sp.]